MWIINFNYAYDDENHTVIQLNKIESIIIVNYNISLKFSLKFTAEMFKFSSVKTQL